MKSYPTFVLTLLLLLFIPFTNTGQTILYQDNFTNQNGKGAYGPNNAYDTTGITDWFLDVTNCILSASTDFIKVRSISGTYMMEARDLDGEAIWKTPSISITGYTEVGVFVDIEQNDSTKFETSDYINIYYKLDNGSEVPFSVNGLNSGGFEGVRRAKQTGLSGDSIRIIIRINNNAGNERHRFFNVHIDGILPGQLSDIYFEKLDVNCIDKMNLSWDYPLNYSPSTSDIIIFAKQGSAITQGTPTINANTYVADNNFGGSGSTYENDAAAKCVYKGDGTSFQLTGLTSGTTYHFLVYSTSGTNYSNGKSFIFTTQIEPDNVLSPVTSIAPGNAVHVTYSYPYNCFTDFLIIARAGSPVNAGKPSGNGSSYTANSSYGLGSSLLGGYVVFKGSSNQATISNLTSGTTYYLKIFTRENTSWSQGVEVSFIATLAPSQGDIYITEYVLSGSTANRYLELYNTTANDINLDGSKIVRYNKPGTVVEYVLDLNTEGNGQNIVPANGFLILSRNSSQANFESYYGVNLGSLQATVNYNNTQNTNCIGAQRKYVLKYGGTHNVADGITIDSTANHPNNGQRIYQTPFGNWDGTKDLNTKATPGSFGTIDDPFYWQMSCNNGNWFNNLQPGAGTGSDNAIIVGGDAGFTNNSQINDLYIRTDGGALLSNENVTVNGNLTIEPGGSVAITGSGDLSVSGTADISQVSSGSSMQYNIWSVPLTGNINILNTFTGVNPCDVYCFQGSNQTWKYDYNVPYSTTCNGNPVTFNSNHIIPSPEGSPDGNFDIARGYFIPGNTTNPTITFSGSQLNNGPYTFPIYGSDAVTPPSWAGNDWNLVGNPYPSAISVSTFLNTNSGLITNALYLLNASTGLWETYNNTDVFGIASCQGFFVDANTTQTGLLGNLQFDNSMRNTDNGNFRNSYSLAIFQLISSATGLNDGIRIYFSPNASDSIDQLYDAKKMQNDNFNFATIIENKYFVFNSIKPLKDGKVKEIPLFVEVANTALHFIELDSTLNLPGNLHFYIYDNRNGKTTEITKRSPYRFVPDSIGVLSNRFLLILSADNTTSVSDELQNNSSVQAYVANDVIHVTGQDIKRISVYDLQGKLLYRSSPPGDIHDISANNLSKGIYLVEILKSDGEKSVVKVALP